MSYTRFIKGKRTELTYKVIVYHDWIHWDAKVYEPYLRRRFWGLFPDVLDYRYVFHLDRGPYHKYLTPNEIQELANRVVEEYESHKIAWESHGLPN